VRKEITLIWLGKKLKMNPVKRLAVMILALAAAARNIRSVAGLNMKMILASKEKFLLDKAYDLLGISKDKLKIGVVNTAFQAVEDRNYIKYMEEYYTLMTSSGIDFKQFDIKGKTETEILEFFADRNVVQISGGNVFYLLKAVREIRFDLILKKFFKEGKCCVACSAGSYLMCPTVEVASWKIDKNRYGILDFTALAYVPFLIKCHFTDSQRAEIIERVETLTHPLRVLRDDQCFYIEDNQISFVGSGEETQL
jgi:peptidase E